MMVDVFQRCFTRQTGQGFAQNGLQADLKTQALGETVVFTARSAREKIEAGGKIMRHVLNIAPDFLPRLPKEGDRLQVFRAKTGNIEAHFYGLAGKLAGMLL